MTSKVADETVYVVVTNDKHLGALCLGVFREQSLAVEATKSMSDSSETFVVPTVVDECVIPLLAGKRPYDMTFHEDGTLIGPYLSVSLAPSGGYAWVWPYPDAKGVDPKTPREIHVSVWAPSAGEAAKLGAKIKENVLKELPAA